MSISSVCISWKAKVRKPIYDITPFSALDYPDKTACIIWFAGCNMRCLYCYNPAIVQGKGKKSYTDALNFLKKRGNLLDGVVLSGGECMLHKGLEEFADQVKALGMLLKVDTNGSCPQKLQSMIWKKQVDYVALDFKAPPKTFKEVTKSNLFNKFDKSLDMLLNADIPFEVRTTYHSDLHSIADLQDMADFLNHKGYNGTFYIQNSLTDTPTLGNLPPSTSLTFNHSIRSAFPVILRNR